MAREIGRKAGSVTAGKVCEGKEISHNSFCYRGFRLWEAKFVRRGFKPATRSCTNR